MECISCGKQFYSAEGDIVPICSQCIVSKAGADPEQVRPGAGQGEELQEYLESLRVLFPELELIEPIGAGGMGTVFKARQRSLDRLVALKVLNPELCSSPEFQERFEREARAMALLNHPNIVSIYDFGEREDLPYLIMEYVDGRDLQWILTNESLDRPLAFSITEQICEALHHAHLHQVIHRDLKPANILITGDGVAKIGDFGLARIKQPASSSDTISEIGMGTPSFVAPEQMNDAKSVDARADVFALGVVIYVMFTGQLPAGDFPAPTSRFPRPSRRLDKAILRAMAPNPEQRLDDIREITRILRSLEKNQPPISPKVLMAILLTITLVVLALGALLLGRNHSPALFQAKVARYKPTLEECLPKTGLPGTDEFEALRRKGGVLRRWTEIPGLLNDEADKGYNDLVSVSEAPRVALSWWAFRTNGETISSQPRYHGRTDFRTLNHSFAIDWPDRLVSVPKNDTGYLPLVNPPVDHAIDLTQQQDVAYILKPDGTIAFAATDYWIRTHHYVLDRLEKCQEVVAIDARPRTFVAHLKDGGTESWADPQGFFDPPPGTGRILQVEAGARHVIGLKEDGSVVIWHAPDALKHPRFPPVMEIPADLPPVIRVTAFDFIIAVQLRDGSWRAWGDDQDRGLIDQINSIGVALDLACFNMNNSTGAKMVWIEPASR